MRIVTLVLTLALMPAIFAADVRGTVRLSDGSPAPGAEVWAASMKMDGMEFNAASADSGGHYTLNLGEGTYMIFARSGAKVGKPLQDQGVVEINEDSSSFERDIALGAGQILRGRIIDEESGAPIPNGRCWFDMGRELAADETGSYVFEGLTPGEHEMFNITPGYERIRFLFDTTLRTDPELDIYLRKAGKIVGTVADEEGKPIPNAIVGRPTSGTMTSVSALIVRSNEQGEYEWDGAVFDHEYDFQAYAPGYEEGQDDGLIVTEIDPITEHNFTLRKKQGGDGKQKGSSPEVADAIPTRAIAGIVRDPKGNPIPGAEISWGATNYEDVDRVTTSNDAGAFALANVPDRAGYITVLADRWAPAFVKVESGDLNGVRVQLEPGVFVAGTVTDAQGNPVPDTWVIPIMASPDPSLCNQYSLVQRSTHTDGQGRFRIEALGQTPMQFTFLAQGCSPIRDAMLTVNSEDNTVKLEAVGAIRGRVVDPQGNPVRQSRILVQIPRDRASGKEFGGFFAGYTSTGITVTNDSGEFIVTELVAGRYHRIVAEAAGFSDAINDLVEAHPVTAMPPAAELTLTLEAPRPAALQIADDKGKPVDGALVMVIDAAELSPSRFQWGYDDRAWTRCIKTHTNAEGHAAFDSIPYETALFIIRKPGFARLRRTWDGAEAAGLTLDLEGRVEGTATTASGKPMANCAARLNASAGDAFYCEIGPEDQGRFSFTELPPSNYTLTVMSDRQTLFTEQFDLPPGETHTTDAKAER